ncbi:MAG: Uma2 family endonuclease [Bacteroidota bacterium]
MIVDIPDQKAFEIQMLGPYTHEEFDRFCVQNPKLRAELEPDGKISIMSPVHLLSASRENLFSTYLTLYGIETGLGEAFNSNAAFTLPNGSVRAPDASFVYADKLAGMSEADWSSFPSIVPEFVVEVRSDSDRLNQLKKKMTDTWIANGVQLGWLVDPQSEIVYLYRADGTQEEIHGFDQELSGEEILPGFTFKLSLLRR